MKPLSKLWAVVTVFLLTLVAFPSIALAADTVPVNPADTLASVRLSATALSFVVGAVLPLVVGVLTNLKTSSFVKGGLLLVLNAVNAFVAQATLADGSAVFEKSAVMLFVVGAATSLVTYYTAWRSKGLTSSLRPVKVIDPTTNSVTVVHVPGKLSGTGFSAVR